MDWQQIVTLILLFLVAIFSWWAYQESRTSSGSTNQKNKSKSKKKK